MLRSLPPPLLYERRQPIEEEKAEQCQAQVDSSAGKEFLDIAMMHALLSIVLPEFDEISVARAEHAGRVKCGAGGSEYRWP